MSSTWIMPTRPPRASGWRLALTAALLLCLGRPAAAQDAAASGPRALLDKYCVTCHNARTIAGGLVLDGGVADVNNVGAQRETWEKVLRKLRVRAMPPAGARRPDEADYSALTRWLTTSLDAGVTTDPGRPSLHRLNRAEYANAVR